MRQIPCCGLGLGDRPRALVAWSLRVVLAGVLVVTQSQAAAGAGAAEQSVIPLEIVATTQVLSGAPGPTVASTPEIRAGIDVGVETQAAAGAATGAAAPLQSGLRRRSGLPIPGKETGHKRYAQSATVASAAANALPSPPTSNPSPPGLTVIDQSSAVPGFAGLTHLDQRSAGTGAYVNTQFSEEPPDQGLCVGNGFVVETVNNAIAVYDTQGNLLAGPAALSQFFGLAPEIIRASRPIYGPSITDPRCAYDRQTGRWFVTEAEVETDRKTGNFHGRSHNLIAVSRSSDPRGDFVLLKYDVTDDGRRHTPAHANCPCYGDQPLLGLDAFGVYQSTNEFPQAGNGFNGAQIYAISKQGLVAAADGGRAPAAYHIDAGAIPTPDGADTCCWYSIQPAIGSLSQDPNTVSGDGVEFFLSALDFSGTVDNRLAVWALTNTRSLTTPSPALHLSLQVIAAQAYGYPGPAQQKAGLTPLGSSLGLPLEVIDTNDDRMNQVVYAGGRLYGAVNTAIGDGSRTGIAWFAVQPSLQHGVVSGAVVQQGYVAVDRESVIFPSIAVDDDGAGLIGFTLVGPDYYPSAAFVRIGGGEVSAVQIAAHGGGPEDGFSGYPDPNNGNVARWGDYSAAVSDGERLWWATEYIPNAPRTVFANWGTWVGVLKP